MKLRHLFVVNAVICLTYGLPFAVVPTLLLSLYGVPPTGVGLLVARLFGAMMLAVGGTLWTLRNVSDTPAARGVALWFCLVDALSAAFFVQAALVGDVNAFGWSVVAIYGLNAIAFGLLSRAPAASAAPLS